MTKQNWFFIGAIFVFTVAVAFLYFKFGPMFPVEGDTIVSYDPIAINIAQGEGFSIQGIPTAEVTPGYPIFLAIIYYIFGHSYTAVRIVQFLILALIGILVFFIGKNYLKLSPALSFLSSLTVILWPYFILYSTFILTEVLFTFFLLLSVLFLLKFQEDPSNNNALVLGALFGISALTRYVVFFLPFWVIFFLLALNKFRVSKSYFLKITMVLFIFLLMLIPWTIRNYIQFNKFIPAASVVQGTLTKSYVELNYTEGSVALKPGEATFKTIITARLKNIYLFWNPGAQGEHARQLVQAYPVMNILFLMYKISFFVLLGLAFFSLKFRKEKSIFLMWIIIFYFWLLHTILFPYPRYTLPIIPLTIVLAFYSLNYLSSRYNLKYISR